MPMMRCRRTLQRSLFPAFCSLLTLALVPADLHAADAVPVPAPLALTSPTDDPATNVSGYFSTRYVYRTAASSDARFKDQDVFADLGIDVARPKDERYELHFLGAVRSDLDGNQNAASFSPLEGAADTYGSRSVGIIYEAFATLNSDIAGSATKTRIGRQSGTRDEPLVFDGIAVDVGEEKWNLALYGGAAVHYYEVNNHWGSDSLDGAGIDYHPLLDTGMSVDYLRVKDEQTLFPEDRTQYDRLLALKAWQRFGTFTNVTGKYRFLDGEPRDLAVNTATTWQTNDLDASVNYFRQFRTQNELSNDLSLYFSVIGSSAPYESYDIKVRKFFADRYALDLGYFKRKLLDRVDEGPFNKEYTRSFIDVEVMGLILPNLSGTLLAEQWESRGNSYGAFGVDLSYRIKRNKKEAKVSMGTNYSLYKYDYYTELGLREKVRTYYLNGKYPLKNDLSMTGGYEYEHGIENYQTLRLGMRYDF